MHTRIGWRSAQARSWSIVSTERGDRPFLALIGPIPCRRAKADLRSVESDRFHRKAPGSQRLRIDPAGVGRSPDAFIDVRLLPATDPENFERRRQSDRADGGDQP